MCRANKKSRFHRIVKYYREHGIYGSILHSFVRIGEFSKKIAYNKTGVIFFELNMDDLAFNTKIDMTSDLSRAEKEDIECAEYLGGWFPKDKALRCLDEGRFLLVLKDKGKVIFYQLLEFNKAEIKVLEISSFIPAGTAYTSYLYTLPEYRGRGVASKAKPLVLKYLYDHGYRRVFNVIASNNIASQRVNKKAGLNPYQTVLYRRFLFLRYYRVKDYETNRKKLFLRLRRTDNKLWKAFSKIG